ncbi:zip zinc transporter family protein, putative [Ichthyophthirius multifiliis]|uniref:Zip zinc transporter family protein, putative n=1 Tax=Ichthyophthirius multifiliis TaxID=5932 RepID=G0R3U7_ICHMU|nr:zip zinc transporter family protein, putative [Ichthyophthirius multifiliis]EGR27854.1 zip zinc transporter family protein, putative [Ichthyophthirius multifiliis]|eukprot:XP_004027199.1 zip zinc transporter family protein, putative [Ichthyophthirius multifiliis]
MLIMFAMIMITGNIPLRLHSFKQNLKVLALSSAFSGGLFLTVGLVHLLPEANEHFDKYFKEINHGEDQENFPWAFVITLMSFSLILFIEKVATDHHEHDANKASHLKASILNRNAQQHHQSQLVDNVNIDSRFQSHLNDEDDQDENDQSDEQFQENIIRQSLNPKKQFASKISFMVSGKKKGKINLAPYLLQVAVGIHAVFEGLAIGIENDWLKCLTLAAAVCCHKWAEGLTLGLAFRKANVDLKMSSIMIAIQALMNPIGVGLGLALSDQGELITGIFMAISTGTFIYIATLEVLVEEFSVKRYKFVKFLFFLAAGAFITSLWFLEQVTGG